MAILHGSWITATGAASGTVEQLAEPEGYFFLWGETWRRIDPIEVPDNSSAPLPQPFAMTEMELRELLRSLHQSQAIQWSVVAFPLQELVAAGTSRRKKASDPAPVTQASACWQPLVMAMPTYRFSSAVSSAEGAIALIPQLSEAAGISEEILQAAAGESSDEAPKSNHEATLERIPWQLQGIRMSAAEAIPFLQSLPLSVLDEVSWLGADLRFWSHIARWHLDLLARTKFLPILDRQPQGDRVSWRVLLDSAIDQARLEQFSRHMPPACRSYRVTTPDLEINSLAVSASDTRSDTRSDSGLASETDSGIYSENNSEIDSENNSEINSGINLETDSGADSGINPVINSGANSGTNLGTNSGTNSAVMPLASARPLLLDFLNSTIAHQICSVAAQVTLPTASFPKDLPLREWLQALGTQPSLEAEEGKRDRLANALTQWTAPLHQQLTQQRATFRTCFYLNPPAMGQSDWRLEYFLQAVDDPDFLVGARTVWQNPVDRLEYMGRQIDQPQESLLAGLGLASRLYPLLEPSLQVQQPQSSRLNPMQVYEFLKSVAWRLQDSGFGVVLPPGLSNGQGWANRLGLRVQAETPSAKKNQRLGLQSLLNFKWELTIGGQRLSKAEFDRLVALNTPLVEINGEWVELRQQDVKAAQTFFASRKDQMALSLEDALRISTGDTQMVEKLPVVGFEATGALQELINTLTSGNQSVDAIAIPPSFQGELRPYQVRGASWLAFLERWGLGACLADDMGLGKTVQFIALMLFLKEQEVLEKPTLLVCPTSVLGNWEREVKRFAPDLQVMVHHGDRRPQGKAFAKAVQDKHLIITSYSLIHRDAKDLQGVSWQGVVLDEAQNIKNAESKQSQAVRQLETQHRIALTGTPVENRLSELWSIMDFLNPGYLGPRNFFQRRFAVPIERYGDTDSLKTLRSLVQPFILRRLKTDRTIIQDLPDKQEMTVFCGLTAQQAALYQKLVDQSLVDIESAEGIQRHGLILALLVRLKQVCNHPTLLKDKSEENGASLSQQSGKLQRLEEMLEEVLAEGDSLRDSQAERSLIFTQFAEWGKHLQAYLQQRFGREVLFLYGGSSKKQREDMVDRFQNDPQAPRIFILSLKAGGVGLNLTRANHVFHFDRWWNPAVENQATDRVFRIGQMRNVQVHKFVCTGTLEERIHELIESKKALSEQVVGAGENWLTELDTDQLRNLLLLDRTAVIDD
ncbi:MAG: SNF2-related protein [Oculatellaceae cyanobacterium Prado106]|jgi:SNF2 family DNA or RNA helicase|nr:SNF2-related protein [Oculatellaceae cyanobacterium Prado106]